MVDELNHRAKNTLATVMTISAQSLRTATSLEAFGKAFRGRLVGLSQTHTPLNRTVWTGATLPDPVEQALAPFADRDRTGVAGDDVDTDLERASAH